MKLSEIVQGKWLGHPLHPAIVHVPIGAWIVACVLDVVTAAGWTHGGPRRLALYCTAVGLLAALVAIPPGLADWLPIKKDKPAKKLGLYHMLLNVAAMVVWGINFWLRLATERAVDTGIVFTSVLGTLLVLVSGYLGSLLVFDQGTSVARLSKKEWRTRAVRGGARVPEET